MGGNVRSLSITLIRGEEERGENKRGRRRRRVSAMSLSAALELREAHPSLAGRYCYNRPRTASRCLPNGGRDARGPRGLPFIVDQSILSSVRPREESESRCCEQRNSTPLIEAPHRTRSDNTGYNHPPPILSLEIFASKYSLERPVVKISSSVHVVPAQCDVNS